MESPVRSSTSHATIRSTCVSALTQGLTSVPCVKSILRDFGITDGSKDPLSVEKQLRAVIPGKESSNFCHRMVLHGRALCMARKPNCAECPLKPDCDFGKTQ